MKKAYKWIFIGSLVAVALFAVFPCDFTFWLVIIFQCAFGAMSLIGFCYMVKEMKETVKEIMKS